MYALSRHPVNPFTVEKFFKIKYHQREKLLASRVLLYKNVRSKEKLSEREMISLFTRKVAKIAIYSCDLSATGVAVIYE